MTLTTIILSTHHSEPKPAPLPLACRNHLNFDRQFLRFVVAVKGLPFCVCHLAHLVCCGQTQAAREAHSTAGTILVPDTIDQLTEYAGALIHRLLPGRLQRLLRVLSVSARDAHPCNLTHHCNAISNTQRVKRIHAVMHFTLSIRVLHQTRRDVCECEVYVARRLRARLRQAAHRCVRIAPKPGTTRGPKSFCI